jgi:hypothetical protein
MNHEQYKFELIRIVNAEIHNAEIDTTFIKELHSVIVIGFLIKIQIETRKYKNDLLLKGLNFHHSTLTISG